jgi:RNA polymerase sigma-70 factor (ECF subfamily)
MTMDAVGAEKLLKHFVEEDAVLRAYVYAATRSQADARDVLQEVWKTLAVKLDQYDEARSFRSWALGVARIQVLKWRQEKARSKEIPSGDVLELLAKTADEHADEIDLRLSFLNECLAKMTMVWRNLLEMKYLGGMKIAEISARTKRSVAAVEMGLVRSRRALRDCVERRMHEERQAWLERKSAP